MNKVEEHLAIIDSIVKNCDIVIDNCPEGEDFASSIKEKAEGIRTNIEEYKNVTFNQQKALGNMYRGIVKWSERIER